MMRFVPFSQKETSLITDTFQQQKWVQRNTIDDKFEFFVDKQERIISITIEYQMEPPFKMREYFVLGRVKFSLIASIGRISEEFLKKLVLYWSHKLRDIDLVFKQAFSIEKFSNIKSKGNVKKDLLEKFLPILPQAMHDKDENVFFQLIRLALAKEKINLDYPTCKKIVEMFKELKLLPTYKFDEIYELKKGLAPTILNNILVFKNPDYEEKIFLEPGYLTYFRDIELENVKMRFMVDTYALKPLQDCWNVELESFIKEILKSARFAFTGCINTTGIADFKKVYFIKKNFDLFVAEYIKNFDPSRNPDSKHMVFAIPGAAFDNIRASELIYPTWNLFTKPPESFDELQARKIYIDSKKQTKHGNFNKTVSDLSAALAIFNKAGQKYGFFLSIVELARIAARVNNYQEAKAKYELALDFAMKNENLVNEDEIIVIQQEFAETCIKFNDLDNAVRQYTLLFNYLQRARPETDSKRIDMLIKLNEIFISRNDFSSLENEIQDYFKKIKSFADKHKDKFIISNYYRVLGMYYSKKGKLSNAASAFKKGLSEAQDMELINVEIDIIIEMGKLYLYSKKKNLSLAERYLEQANQIVGRTDNLRRELEIYEMLHDLYLQEDNMELAGHYNRESQRLRTALKSRGLI